MPAPPVAAPSLQELMTALDQLDAPAATRALAPAVVKIRDEEGKSTDLNDLLEVVRGVPHLSAAANGVKVPPVPNCPHSAVARAFRLGQAARAEKIRRRANGLHLAAMGMAPLGLVLMAWVLPSGVGHVVSLLCDALGIGSAFWAVKLRRGAAATAEDMETLARYTPSSEELQRWSRVPHARAYLRQHTQGEVPLLAMDVPHLNDWVTSHDAIQTYLEQEKALLTADPPTVIAPSQPSRCFKPIVKF